MEIVDRNEIAEQIYLKIVTKKNELINQFSASKNQIGYFFLDDLLPNQLAHKIKTAFPNSFEMIRKRSIREDKFVAAQMNLYDSLLEEVIYGFQDEKIVNLIGEICNIETPIPDENLYAGGISMMGKNQFLNPHLDNSHDKNRQQWRVLNLLYYVTPNWEEDYGGNLELWPNNLQEKQITIHSKFNRLVVMATHNSSLHSVSPIVYDGFRCCISNYYFSKKPLQITDTFHITSFRGRPENKLTDKILRFDTFLRMNVRKIFKKGIIENPHVYRRNQ